MDSELIEEAERGNREIQARDHRALFAAVERERLVSEAATAILASEGIEPQEDGTYWGENTWPNAVKDAATALAVFEAAQKPADDEREALANLIPLDLVHDAGREGFPRDAFEAADRIIASDVWQNRRPVSPSNDEREALARAQWDDPVNVITWDELTAKAERDEGDYREVREYALEAAGRGIAAGFRRPVSPEPNVEEPDLPSGHAPVEVLPTFLARRLAEPQTEPTDAQVEVAVTTYIDARLRHDSQEQAMRAALRAAAETTNENGSRSDG